MNSKRIADIIALKELTDNVSILADRKQIYDQVQLFSENAISETFIANKLILKVKGRNNMEKAFTEILKNFETVYHFNGQHTVKITGDKAIGISYCLITLIGTEDGRKQKTSIGAIYHDDYVRLDDCWYIARRIGDFEWQEKREIDQ